MQLFRTRIGLAVLCLHGLMARPGPPSHPRLVAVRQLYGNGGTARTQPKRWWFLTANLYCECSIIFLFFKPASCCESSGGASE